MPRLAAETINLSESERAELEQILRRAKTPQQIALRAKIILRSAEGKSQGEIAAELGISIQMSRLWRRRWLLLTAKEVGVEQRLEDLPRPGSRRSSFTSTDALKSRILEFVDYFNRTMAKPFKWNYTGKPLVA